MVNAGKSIKTCCCKCYYYINKQSLCYHLLTAGVVVGFSHISQKISFSKYFFILLENVSSLLLEEDGPLSLEQFHLENLLHLTEFRSQLMKFPGMFLVQLLQLIVFKSMGFNFYWIPRKLSRIFVNQSITHDCLGYISPCSVKFHRIRACYFKFSLYKLYCLILLFLFHGQYFTR